MKKELPVEWIKWIEENLARGCTHESIIEILINNNFEFTFSKNAVAQVANSLSDATKITNTIAEPAKTEKNSSQFVYETPRIPQMGNTIKTDDRDVHVTFRLARPVIAQFDNFMSHEECDELIRLSEAKLTRSTIVDPKTGKGEIIEARSSYGTYFNVNENPFIQKLDKRIAAVMNWPVENGEGIQILNYKIGGEYKPHFDYFSPNESGSAPHLARGGQRVSTLVMYLNDVEEGGETLFPTIGFAVTPKKGSAVYFEYCNSKGQVDPLTLHGGNPVTKGSKWIATKWMRENRFS